MKKLALALLVCSALILPACGNGTVVIAGASSITVTSITGSPFITVTPTVFQVTGTEFAQAGGGSAIVRFTAEGGILAFDGGTSNTLDVPVTILDDGTVEGTTPSFLFPGIFNAFVTVILPGTAEGTSETAIAQFIGIQVDSVTPNTVPSDSGIPLVIGGTGFSPPAGNVSVRYIAETGTPFLGGTTDTIGPVAGTVASLTQINSNAAIAGVNINAPAFVEVTFTDLPGMPVIQSANPIVTFTPPTVDSVSLANVPSEIPTPLTITGTGYGPVASNVNVTLTADAGTPFLNGTAASLMVTGTVTSATTIDITTPIFQVATPTQPTNVTIALMSGAGATSAAPLFSVDRPTVDSVDLANVPGEVPTFLTITGTGFAPNASAPTIRFRAPAGTPFLGGTAAFLDVTGTVVNDTTITCTTPRAGISAATAAEIGVFLTTGITEVLSAGTLVTFDPPAITSTAPLTVQSEIPETVTITGTGFGSATGQCTVTFEAAVGTPFTLGAVGSIAVTGTVVNPTTITCTSPIAGVQADALAGVRLTFPTLAVAVASNQITFLTPTVTASSLAAVDSENPTFITITGTGFAGGTPTVRFASAGTPFTGGTLGTIDATGVTLVNDTTITCTTPRAGVLANAPATIQVLLTGGLTPISAGNLITFNAPTTTSCAPLLIDPQTATLVTVTGTGYFAPGTVTVRFTAAAGTPFSGSATLDVTGTVVNPTTVTCTTPVLAALPNKAVCSVTVIFASGAAPASGPGCTTFEAPPVAVDDNYGADGNVLLTVNAANGLIQGVGTDSDPDGDVITVSAFDAASVQGGTVSVAADGSFTYDPPVGYTGPDSFTYTITDGFLFDTATVNITVSGMVWFINNNLGAAGNGTFSSPFNTLAGFIASPLDGTGDTIFLYSSATDYTGNLTLLDNQILLGQGVDLVHPGGNSVSPLVAATVNPTIDSTTGTTISVAAGNTIRGLDIASTAGDALAGSAVGTLTIDSAGIESILGAAINIDGSGTLAVTLQAIMTSSSPSDAIDLVGVGGSFSVTGPTFLADPGNDGINIENTAAGAAFTFASITVFNPRRDGICLNNHDGSFSVTGTTTLDDRGGANTMDNGIDINDCDPATTFTFGTVDIDRPTLDGICLTDVNGAGVTFGTTTIDNCGQNGIDIDSSAGTFTFSSIDVSTTTSDGIDLFLFTGSLQVTGNATLNGAGESGIEVLASTANIDFGSVTINSSGEDGILLDGAGGTFDVTGRCNIVTPGSEASTPSQDHGVDINGGSIAVTFADLDVSDSTGHCVEISNTTGAISITGDLGAGDSGGADLHNTDDVGIHCTNCTGTLTFRDMAIDESGDGAVNAQESHGIRIDDCTGNITIDGCVIDDCAETTTGAGQGFDNNCVHVRMDDGGTLPSLQITDCTFGGTEVAGVGTTTDHGVFIRLEGNSRITDLDVTGCLCSDVGRAFCEILVDGDDSGDNCQIANCNVSNNGTVANPIESQGEGIHLRVNGVSTVPLFAIDGNIMNGGALSAGPGIRLNTGEFGIGVFNSTASATGTINDNDIDNVGGGGNGGISVLIQESTTLVVEIDNNDVDGVAHPTALGVAEDGINVRSFDASSGNVTISNNSIGLNTLNIDNGIFVETTFALAGHSLCVDVFGNNCAAGDDIVMAWVSGVFGIDSLTPTPATAAQVDTFLQAQNTGTANSTGAGSPFTACTVTTP